MTHICPYIDHGSISYLVNLFFPVTEQSCFPFFTWFFFPAFGLCLGEALVRCKDKKKFYRILLPISLCGVLFVYLQFYLLYPNYTDYYFGGNFYYMGIINVILTTAFICFSLSSWYYAGKYLPQLGQRYLSYLSKNVNVFHILSWMIISAMLHIKAYCCLTFDSAIVIALMGIVIILCSVLTPLAVHIKNTIHKKVTWI